MLKTLPLCTLALTIFHHADALFLDAGLVLGHLSSFLTFPNDESSKHLMSKNVPADFLFYPTQLKTNTCDNLNSFKT